MDEIFYVINEFLFSVVPRFKPPKPVHHHHHHHHKHPVLNGNPGGQQQGQQLTPSEVDDSKIYQTSTF